MKKNLKFLVAMVLFSCATMSANAQFENKRETARYHFGIRAGLSANTLTGDGTEGVMTYRFPTGGLAWDFQVAQIPIFVGIGLNYLNQGYKYKLIWNRLSYGSIYSDRTYTQEAHSIHIPLVVGYHLNIAPKLFVSPFVGGFWSHNFTELGIMIDSRNNYGLRLGCGMNYGRLTLDLAYDFGLRNLTNGDSSIHTGLFFATIGVNFAGNR